MCVSPASRHCGSRCNMGLAPVILQKLRLSEKERATATSKATTSATAKFAKGVLVLKRRGFRGLLRLAFAVDLRSRFYRCAGGKQLLRKARDKAALEENGCYCYR